MITPDSFPVLIVTSMSTSGGVGVSSIVVEFSTDKQAQTCIDNLNKDSGVFKSTRGIKLYDSSD